MPGKRQSEKAGFRGRGVKMPEPNPGGRSMFFINLSLPPYYHFYLLCQYKSQRGYAEILTVLKNAGKGLGSMDEKDLNIVKSMHPLGGSGGGNFSSKGRHRRHHSVMPFPDFEYARAAFIKEANRGCDVRGLDLNSG